MRGDKRLFVSSTARFSMNAWVRLLLDNRNNSLVADLHSGLIPPDPSFNNRNDAVMFNFKVTEVSVCQRQQQMVTHALTAAASSVTPYHALLFSRRQQHVSRQLPASLKACQ
jgi:hypothetical protein